MKREAKNIYTEVIGSWSFPVKNIRAVCRVVIYW
jgi:hypothetical protein